MPSASPSSLTPVSDVDMPLTPAPSPQIPAIAGESVIELQSALMHIQHQALSFVSLATDILEALNHKLYRCTVATIWYFPACGLPTHGNNKNR